jgi:hypothetical protein
MLFSKTLAKLATTALPMVVVTPIAALMAFKTLNAPDCILLPSPLFARQAALHFLLHRYLYPVFRP